MIKGRVKRKIYFTGGKILSIINRAIPKNQNKILIFCRGELCDNSETLFHHLLREGYNTRYEIVCAVSNPDAYQRYKKQNENVRFVNLLRSVQEIMTAGHIFCHGEMIAIKPSPKQVSVNYWHGTPLKKINAMLDKLGDYDYDFFTMLTASSEMFRPIMAEAFRCSQDKILIAGHPRNDDLFGEKDELYKLGINKEEYQKIFAWLPTYRMSRDGLISDSSGLFLENSGIPLFHSEDSLKELNEFMKNRKSLLLIKLHPAQKLNGIKCNNMSHVKILTNDDLVKKQVGLYRILKDADALVTDYSSVFFDYLLLNRPIGFVIEDMQEYENCRGFVVKNPLEYMPGVKIEKRQGWYDFVDLCIEGKDEWMEKRQIINKQINKFSDGQNCKRLLQELNITKE